MHACSPHFVCRRLGAISLEFLPFEAAIFLGACCRQALSGPVLRDTARLSQRRPLLRAMGFLVSQHGQLGAIPPPPFLSVSPLESMRSGGVIPPPPQKGYLSDTCAIPYENRQMGAIPPSAILSRKGIARYGGVSKPRMPKAVVFNIFDKHTAVSNVALRFILTHADPVKEAYERRGLNLHWEKPLCRKIMKYERCSVVRKPDAF